MKRYLSIILVAMCAFLSCAKIEEDRQQEEKGLGTKIFYAQTPSEETRIFIDNEYAIHWTADDRISVFCSSTNEQYRFTGKTGDDSGSFENIEEPATPTYSRNYAVYPYQEGNTSSSEGTIAVTLPSTQNYAEQSFGLGANTMAAATEDLSDDTFKFKNVCGYVMLKLYGGDKIKNIRFRGNNGEKIAGEATITASPKAKPVVAMGPSSTTEIILACPEGGVATQESSENYTQFWIVVPPTTFTKGFTIEITNTDDAVVSRSTNKSIIIKRNEVTKMAPVKVDFQNSKELLSFSLSDGTNAYEAFDISNGYVNVQVPNETDMTNMTATFQHNGASVKVNGVVQTSGVDKHDFSDFVHPLTYVVTSKGGSTQSYIIRMFNLPIVFATTPNGKPITSKEVWTENCTFKIRDTDGTVTDYGSTNLKGRGNASWSRYAKKPYAVKFETKQNVLGMPAHKRWCLLMNEVGYYYSNAIGFELGKRTSSLCWTPSSIHVEFFLNGEHKGLFTITEQIKVDKNRVNITEMSSTDVEGDAITGGYLLTYDTSFDELNKFRSQYFNMPVMFKEPDEDVLVQAQFNYLQNYINNFEASLKDNTRFSQHEYLNYFDIDSYIDMWFVWEMAGYNEGLLNGSDFTFPRSVYFSKDRNDIIRSGPLWDFNMTLFFRQTILCNKCQYYGRLFEDTFFKSRVKEKWYEFKARVRGEREYDQSIISFLDEIHNSIDKASKRDWDMWWKNGAPYFSYLNTPDEQYQLIHDGIYPKLDYLESYINSLAVDYDALPGSNEDVNCQQDETDNFYFGF